MEGSGRRSVLATLARQAQTPNRNKTTIARTHFRREATCRGGAAELGEETGSVLSGGRARSTVSAAEFRRLTSSARARGSAPCAKHANAAASDWASGQRSSRRGANARCTMLAKASGTSDRSDRSGVISPRTGRFCKRHVAHPKSSRLVRMILGPDGVRKPPKFSQLLTIRGCFSNVSLLSPGTFVPRNRSLPKIGSAALLNFGVKERQVLHCQGPRLPA